MLVGPMNVHFMDEISTGLDSSTTFEIVQSLQRYCHILETTVCIALLQPAPEVFELFDDVRTLTLILTLTLTLSFATATSGNDRVDRAAPTGARNVRAI